VCLSGGSDGSEGGAVVANGMARPDGCNDHGHLLVAALVVGVVDTPVVLANTSLCMHPLVTLDQRLA
jgi:hypothetical protein